MRSRSLLLSAAVFFAAATTQGVFSASFAQDASSDSSADTTATTDTGTDSTTAVDTPAVSENNQDVGPTYPQYVGDVKVEEANIDGTPAVNLVFDGGVSGSAAGFKYEGVSYPVNRVKIYSSGSTQGSVRTIENLGQDWTQGGESLYDTIIYNDISSSGDMALWFKDGFQGGSDGRVSIVVDDGVSIDGGWDNGVIQFRSYRGFSNKASLLIGKGSVVKSTDSGSTSGGVALKLSNFNAASGGVDLVLVMDNGSKLIGGGANPIAISMTNGIAHKLDLTVNTDAQVIGNIVIGLTAEGNISLKKDAQIIGAIQMNNSADTLENYGIITGNVSMGAGNDTMNNYGTGEILSYGDIGLGSGDDGLSNTGSIIAESITMGDGSNTLTNKGGSTIVLTGSLSGGSGVDSITNTGSALYASDIDLGAANDTLSNTNGGTITATSIKMRGGADTIKNYGVITTVEDIQMAGGADTLINYKAGTINSKSINMGNGDDVFKNKGTLKVDSISLGSGSDVIYVDSPINARTDGGTLTIDGGSDPESVDIDVVRFGADGGTGSIDGSNYINFEKAVQEGGTWNYDKDFSHIPQFIVRGGVMEATDSKPATFNNLTLNGGTIQADIHDHDGASYPAPIKVVGNFNYQSGSLVIKAEQMSNPDGAFKIIDIEGSETEISELAANSYLQYGDTESAPFTGLGKENELKEPALRDVYLEKGSLVLIVEDKTKDEIDNGLTPGNPGGGSSSGGDSSSGGGSVDELLPGCDGDEDLCDIIADHSDDDDAADEDEEIAGDIVDGILLPILDSDQDAHLPMIDYGQLSRLVVSGLMPRNVDAPGQSMTTYNNLLVDNIFERLPLRQFDIQENVEVVVEESIAAEIEADGSELIEVDEAVIVIDDISYVDRNSLTSDYADRDGVRAWFRGFGGRSSFSKTSTVYNGYDISNSGGVVGVDVSLSESIQLGAYANYGQINLHQKSSNTGGGSWNPSGWGGGITADYWTENFYVQGLLGGTGFSGDQKRHIVSIADKWGSSTSTGEKSSSSYVGAFRLGAPFDLGDVLLEPQFTAVWTRNDENSFSESSSHSRLNLKYHSRTTNYFQTGLGMKLAYPIKTGDRGLVVPSLKLAWLRDWDQDNSAQKIGYTFTDRTISVDSNQDSQDGLLVEAGIDYTINNFGSTSLKLYGRGGLEFWDTSSRGTEWRASGGVTFQF